MGISAHPFKTTGDAWAYAVTRIIKCKRKRKNKTLYIIFCTGAGKTTGRTERVVIDKFIKKCLLHKLIKNLVITEE